MNGKFYLYVPKLPRCVLRNVTCRTYVRYVTVRYGSTQRINSTLRFLTSRYITLREGGKQAWVASRRTTRGWYQ